MKKNKIISLFLSAVMLVGVVFAIPSVSAATDTTFNGKTCSVGDTVTYSYSVVTPEKCEDFDFHTAYSEGLSVESYSINGAFEGNIVDNNSVEDRTVYANGIYLAGYDFTKDVTFMTIKFKVTAEGEQTAKTTVDVLDGLSGVDYGMNPSAITVSEVSITVVPATSVKLSASSVKLTKSTSNVEAVVKATSISPSTNDGKIKWYSSSTKVFKVKSTSSDTKSVRITTVKGGVGSAYLVAKNSKNVELKRIKVTVVQRVTAVKMNYKSKTLKKGKYVQLKATASPSNASVKTLKWTTSNSKVATVNSKGKVVAKKKGTAVIKATATDGSKKYAYCKIKVS